ncbi:recombinase family protein [Microbacterium capsulatum]|uniref:Recombinase family protein n=1 Tax=Microbacterium capsulatum TaxID=3041921 RepID=A0ABU0XG21_9MICO|nr:recombinase family protein [Microbacterium sp. ASV81]MDQ4214073.1 recombinase family protein [Microbacterium sp. ASV81]
MRVELDVKPITSNGTLVGYVRVSTGRQDEQLQHDALDREKVLKRNRYVDRGVSGAKLSRPGLDAMLADVQAGDTIIVWKLDRIGRSTAHVISLIHDLTARGVHIRSISDGLDTTTTMGKAMLSVLAIFAEMERCFIRERTMAGLASARAQGRVGGRPRQVNDKKHRQAQALRDSGESVPDIAKTLGVSVATVYRVTTNKRSAATLG